MDRQIQSLESLTPCVTDHFLASKRTYIFVLRKSWLDYPPKIFLSRPYCRRVQSLKESCFM